MRVNPTIRSWLTGPKSDPSVRARYLIEVEGKSPTDFGVQQAQKAMGQVGWAASLLGHQLPGGYWVIRARSAREIYRPKFISTNFSSIVLADLGMTRSDPRIRRTAQVMIGWLDRVLAEKVPEHCLGGNATRTLIRFGYLDHPTVQKSIRWLVRSQKSDGGWHCFPVRSGTLDCWEGLEALADIPEGLRDASTRRAIERGAEFYLKRELRKAGPGRYPPWVRIHYPNHYYYDLLVGLRVLTRLGYGADPRLGPALRWLGSKRRPEGTWALDAVHPDEVLPPKYTYPQPVFPMMLEPIGRPSRWATVEALSVLARVESAQRSN